MNNEVWFLIDIYCGSDLSRELGQMTNSHAKSLKSGISNTLRDRYRYGAHEIPVNNHLV